MQLSNRLKQFTYSCHGRTVERQEIMVREMKIGAEQHHLITNQGYLYVKCGSGTCTFFIVHVKNFRDL